MAFYAPENGLFFSEAISETSIFWEYERPELLKKLIEIIWKSVGG